MIVFRLSKSLYSNDLSGKGAEKAGARWNSKGIAMIYTSDSRALCTAEIAVHTPLGNVPEDYSIITIEIPEDSIREVKIEELPSDWKTFPHPDSTQRIGNKFIIDNIFLVLKVPSAVVQEEYNYLVNPNHRDFHKVKIIAVEPFTFDERLFKK
ncbi:MAG: RES family NAD+ phosphorylase [Bacteroidales bacterium]|nr:RES family NAD+ phosphorylase [Bacteroidales bacterium]